MTSSRSELNPVDGLKEDALQGMLLERVASRGIPKSELLAPDGRARLASLVALGEPHLIEGRGLPPTARVRAWRGRSEEVAEFALAAEERLVSADLGTFVADLAVDLAATVPVEERRSLGVQAIRELLVNAVIHRRLDSESLARLIEVDVYTDGFVVRSPGAVPSSTSPTGFSRNPTLHALAAALGLATQRGLGRGFARQAARQVGWALSEHDEDDRHVVVARVDPSAVDAARAEQLRLSLPPADVDAAVLAQVTRVPRTAREVTAAVGLPPTTVRAALGRLVDAGRVGRTRPAARSKHQAYFLLG